VCRLLTPMSSGILSTSTRGLLLGQQPCPTSALKQVVPSPRRCLTVVQLTSGLAKEIGRDLIAPRIFQRGLRHIYWGPMFYFLNLLGSFVIMYTSTVCVLI
jgi:hypothetical protein